MNLRDVYIDEVTSRIPESMRQDVALELESTIDDMTGNDPSETALFEALRELATLMFSLLVMRIVPFISSDQLSSHST